MRHLALGAGVVLAALIWAPGYAAAQEAATREGATTRPAKALSPLHEKARADLVAAVESLIADLGSPRYNTRGAAKDALVALHEAYLDALQGHLDDPDPERQARVREVLEDVAAVTEFKRALSSVPPEQRSRLQGFREKFPRVATRIFSTRADERVQGVRSIVELNDPDCLGEPVLLLFLRDASDDLVAAAAHAACSGRYKSDAVVDALVDVVIGRRKPRPDFFPDDGDGAPRGRALEAIKQIGSKRAAPPLVAVLVNSSGDVEWGAALGDVVVSLGEKRAIPHLMGMLGQTEAHLTVHAGNDRVRLTIAVSDVALFALLRLTGQNHHTYGFVSTQGWGPDGVRHGFATPEARSKAIEKFRQWWNENKDQAPYKDLEPLKLPKIADDADRPPPWGPNIILPILPGG